MEQIISFLEKTVKRSIKADVRDVALFHGKQEKSGMRGGFFGIPRMVFCYVNFLGKIAYDLPGDTQPSEAFIKDFFPQNYHDYAELIYAMYRHGTVHELVPKTFFAVLPHHRPKRVRMKWLINNDNKKGNRSANLHFHPMHGKKATLHLVLNTCQVADDLTLAFSSFVQKIRSDKKYERQCQRRLDKILRIKDANLESSIKGSNRRKAVLDQFALAWKNRSGKIDKDGRTYTGT